MSKKDDAKKTKQDAPGATGVVNENTNSTGPMTPSEPYPEGTPTSTQVAPPPTPEDYLREQEKGAVDPINLAVEPVRAEVLNIPKDMPYPTQDSPSGYLDIPDEQLRDRDDLRELNYDESGDLGRDRDVERHGVRGDRAEANFVDIDPKEPYPTGGNPDGDVIGDDRPNPRGGDRKPGDL